ncbi:MAG TPA: carboxymuconolactone decarboxylase family protein [Mycobacteriales bacterium]|jgi:AhpD family alkylhydroperoxidase|nr:carboxymuconolactone decarboxylase family protein [Mycobacteriales bacterium]
MPLVPYVEEADATGIVKEVYDDIKTSRKLAKVPNFWRAIAHRPEYLKAEWFKLRDILETGTIDRKTKEMIAVAVSATNNCDYCIRSHTDALRSMGTTDAELVELLSVVDFFNGSNAIASGLKIEYEPAVPAAEPPA